MISHCKVSDKAEKPQSPKVGILNVAQEGFIRKSVGWFLFYFQ